MDCLDAAMVEEVRAGRLDGDRKAAIDAHLATCASCRARVQAAADALRATQAAPADVALLATQMSDAALAVPAPDVGLLATAAAGDEATAAPGDLLATPVLRRGAGQAPLQGKRLGRFTLLERLGAGAMGVVWRAEDPRLGRSVALKLLRRADADLTERLVREARSMAQVNHPNVVTVYEVGEAEDGTSFIAMELVTGQSLRSWQAKRSIPELITAYVAAGRGLAAAHAAGIVHRDFKPDNVLVGEDGRVRVTDFGLAAARSTELGDRRAPHLGDVNLTTSGSVLGTPAYMAPEQFTGGNVDSRTDQFNFCVALYEALYGERPFDGATFTALGDNVMFGRIKDAPAGTRVSSAVHAILLRGLSPRPGDRFATLNDLLTELGRDRARPWRLAAYTSGALAAALVLGLVSDWVVRDRLDREIRQSFALTGAQLARAAGQLTSEFHTLSEIAYSSGALREVAGTRDEADFGLRTEDEDRAEFERLHSTLASADWVRLPASELAIADYKGRLLYSSAAPTERGSDLSALPAVKRALDAGKGNSITVLPYSDPALVASHVLGTAPPRPGLTVLFVRTLALGASEQSEARALYLQLQDGKQLLDNVRLDGVTRLALVTPTGEVASDAGLSSTLVRGALAAREVHEVEDDGGTYLVQARELQGLDGQGAIGHVVMARPLDAILTLFPGARTVFFLTAFLALAGAIGATWRAREITRGRI